MILYRQINIIFYAITIQIITSMRRVSGPPQGSNFYMKKDLRNRLKSPLPAKSKQKHQTQDISTNQTLPIRKSQSFHHKVDSSETRKPSTKGRKAKPSQKSKLKKYQKQIMEVLNNAARVIQRQWRKYMIRKYRKSMSQLQMLTSIQKSPIVNGESQAYRVNKFEEKSGSIYTNENYSTYNNGKYVEGKNVGNGMGEINQVLNSNASGQRIDSQIISEREAISQFSDSCKISEQINHNSPKKYKQLQYSRKEQTRIPKVIKSANYISPNHNRTKSDKFQFPRINQLSPNYLINSKTKNKLNNNLNIQQNAITVTIEPLEQSFRSENSQTPKKPESPHRTGSSKNPYDDCYIVEDQCVIDEVLKKVQQNLQKKKLKKMLDLQNSFQNNIVTFRSYQKNKSQIHEEHLSLLELKKKKLYDKWKEIIELSKDDDTSFILPELKPLELYSTQKFHYFDKQQGGLQSYKKIDEFQNQSEHSISRITDTLELGLNFDSNKKSIEFDDWEWSSDRKINDLHRRNIEQREEIEKIANLSRNKKQDEKMRKRGEIMEGLQKKQAESIQLGEERNAQDVISQVCKSDDEMVREQVNSLLQAKNVDKLQGVQDESEKYPSIRIEEEYRNSAKNKQSQDNSDYLYQESMPDDSIHSLKMEPKEDLKQHKKSSKNFQPIYPTIQYVNNWLLDISHFILDNYINQVTQKLTQVEQPPALTLFHNSLSNQNQQYQYRIITEKQFQTFQYYHIKSIIEENNIEPEYRDTYAALTYCLHQALFQSLNRMLQDELPFGRNWVNYIWFNQFKVRKITGEQHAKQCLQKAINRVSSIADYTIFPLKEDEKDRNMQVQLAQYILVLLEQVYEFSIESTPSKTQIVQIMYKQIYQQIFDEQCQAISKSFTKSKLPFS